jgi:hypothetical protein
VIVAGVPENEVLLQWTIGDWNRLYSGKFGEIKKNLQKNFLR